MKFFLILNYILLSIAVLGGLFGLSQHKYIRKSFIWLAVFLLFSGLAQFLAIYLGTKYGNNKIYLSLLTPFYYILIYLIFSNFSKNKLTIKANNLVFIIGSLPILIYTVISINKVEVAIEAISIANVVYSIAAMIYFLDILNTPLKFSPFKLPKFYALTAFLFYHSAIFFFWTSQKFFQTEMNKVSLNMVNVFMVLIYYCVLFGALIVERKYNPEQTDSHKIIKTK